MLHHNLQHA